MNKRSARDSGAAAKSQGPNEDAFNFEAAMARLEEIVRNLEVGSLSLDQSIRDFEEGMLLVRRCAADLRRVEEQVKRLTEEAGRILAEDFEVPGAAGNETPHDR